MTSDELMKEIYSEGVENIIFNAYMHPYKVKGFTLVRSEEYEEVPCRIDTSKCDPTKHYAITLQPICKGYAASHHYLDDFVELINNNMVKIRGM